MTQTATLHPDEFVLIPSRATLGHTVSPEEYDACILAYSQLAVEALNDPKKKAVLSIQYERQRLVIKEFKHNA